MLRSQSGTGERVVGDGCGAGADDGKGTPTDGGSVEVLRDGRATDTGGGRASVGW